MRCAFAENWVIILIFFFTVHMLKVFKAFPTEKRDITLRSFSFSIFILCPYPIMVEWWILNVELYYYYVFY